MSTPGCDRAFRWNGKAYADLNSFAAAVGIEKHGVRVDKEEIFENWATPVPGKSPTIVHLTLKEGCNAVDAGALLPNINDDFAGQAPDLGALERGKPLPHYGPRRARHEGRK